MTQGVRMSFTDKDYVALIDDLDGTIQSCREALSGEWDRNDEGFEAMIAQLELVRHRLEAARLKAEF